jgi:hypothetical protein
VSAFWREAEGLRIPFSLWIHSLPSFGGDASRCIKDKRTKESIAQRAAELLRIKML